MAGDQRYCLECGARRGEPRVAYRRLLEPSPAAMPGSRDAAPPATPATPATPAVVATAPGGRAGWSLPSALATVACLLLALAIGVMIGRGGEERGGQAAAPAPQVIRVDGAAPTAATTTTETEPAAETEKASAQKKQPAAKTAKQSKQEAEVAAKSAGALEALEEASPEEYQKQSQKLPKEVATQGAPPPKDDKAPAGGGEFEEIG